MEAILFSICGGLLGLAFLGVLSYFASKQHDAGVRYTESGRAFKVDKK